MKGLAEAKVLTKRLLFVRMLPLIWLCKPFRIVLLILSSSVALSSCSKISRLSPQDSHIPPEQVLKQFYDNDGPEDTLMDPLILGGDGVVPLVVKEVKDKDMRRRRYAIGFLGNGSFKQAVPTLESILQDDSEKDYFRGDALHAIFMIDESLGSRYAKTYINRSDYLGEISKRILNGDKSLKERRTYSDALTSRHE